MASADTIIAFDCAGNACSAALWRHGEVRARRFEAMSRGHSERLVPMIEEVMAEAAVAYRRLDAIAVTRGPGGFTGVRIGLATARGLALALDRPIIAVGNLLCVAASVPPDERRGRSIVVLLDAKRNDLYLQAFAADLSPLGAACAVAPERLDRLLPPGPLVLVGDAVEQAALAPRRRDVLVSRAPTFSDAVRVAELAARRPLPAAGFDPALGTEPATALYLRPPDVTLPPGGR